MADSSSNVGINNLRIKKKTSQHNENFGADNDYDNYNKSGNGDSSNSKSFISSTPRTRKDVYYDTKHKLSNVLKHELPKDFHGITVHDFGYIDSRAAFHTQTQILPIGYKCEVFFNPKKTLVEKAGDSSSASSPRKAICEIIQSAGRPEFTLLDTYNNESYSHQVESELWKKVIQLMLIFIIMLADKTNGLFFPKN